MEPHQPRSQRDDARDPPGKRRGRDTQALDAAWLEREAILYVAQWETTRHGLREALERRLRNRCGRTGEDAATVIDAIPEVVQRLVDRAYVDDQRFAEQLIERERRQGRSGSRIRAQLEAKGADPSILAEVEARILEERVSEGAAEAGSFTGDPTDMELEAAFRTAKKRRLGPYCVDPSERADRRQRHLAVLARQGFSRDIAYRVVDSDGPPEIDP